MGRSGARGDELGSSLLGGRLVRDIMRLCFLMERTYAPYAKWFGTAFDALSCGPALAPTLRGVLSATGWQERETHLVEAYEAIARMHNQLEITDVLPQEAVCFHSRPFQVIAVHGFAESLLAEIRDPSLSSLLDRPTIGGIDQFSDNTDLISDPAWRSKIRAFYEP